MMPANRRGEEGYDRLRRVRPLAEALNQRYAAEYTPSAHQAIDSMVLFKARSSLKQYMPLKPIKRGYKIWCRADSEDGYPIQFQIYEGKDSKRPPDVTLGEHVILSLCDDVTPGTQLYFDFSST